MELRTPDVEKRSLTMGKAIVKLSMYVNSGMLTVNILKGRHLYSRYTRECQPFVQVCLEPDCSGGTKCCTAILQDSPHPIFNEKFSFEMLLPSDGKRRLHISAWNQNGPGHTAEFLGSMSFGLQHMLNKNKEHSGWFYLLREEVGRRKHLPAILRSSVYEDVGALTENTPLMSRRDKERQSERLKPSTNKIIADVVVHSDFNAIRNHKAFDSVESQKAEQSMHLLGVEPSEIYQPVTEKSISSPKQVRFNMSHFSSQSRTLNSTLNTESNLESPSKPPPSQNPFILQYRKEISAAENAGKQLVMLNSSLNSTNLNDSGLNESMFANTGSPDCRAKISLNSTTEFQQESLRSSFRNRTLDFSSISARDNSLSSERTRIGGKPEEIWIDCQRLETEHDSGICDSLSPSPKSDTQTCGCCRRKYNPINNISLTSDDKSDCKDEGCFSHNETDISNSKNNRIMRQKCQQFQNDIFCGENGLSEFSTTTNFDECDNCVSNYYGLGRSLLTASTRKSKQIPTQNNDSMHTKIYFL